MLARGQSLGDPLLRNDTQLSFHTWPKLHRDTESECCCCNWKFPQLPPSPTAHSPVSFFRHGALSVNCVPFPLLAVQSTHWMEGRVTGKFNEQTGNVVMN